MASGTERRRFGLVVVAVVALDLAPADRRFVEEWLLAQPASASGLLEGERTASRDSQRPPRRLRTSALQPTK